ncbi:MAG: T9SS type A sorting domain-containing protein [Bacteroidales bacterium]|nr:T9SS type A sorting domain-containing protein [Bacteroidales bacterium]
MKRFYSMVVALLIGATSLFAQTNYTVTFSANVEMEKVQVKNNVSGETKILFTPDNVITLQKNKKQGTAVETVDNSAFLQQTGENTVVVNVEKAGHLNLTLYSMNGTFVARYSNNVDAGPNAFKIGAVSGVYVLVASANNQTASLKIMLTQNSQPSILEVLTDKLEPLLKSIDDVITFDEGDEFEFTGYYKNQTDVKTAVITENKQIVFALNSEPSVNSTQPVDVLHTTATVGGNVTNDNGAAVTERGVCWATTDNPTISDNKEICGDGVGEFTVSLTELADATTYYVRAYAINEVGITYGEIISFTTKTISVPTVSSANISNVSNSSVTIEGAIEDENGAAIIEQGICWATTDNPTISDNKLAADIESGGFSLSLTSLANGTTYYVRTYAVNSIGIAYGETVSFTTTDIPVVATASAKNVLYTTATVDGNVSSDKGASVTERGVCWATTANPTVSDNKVTSGTGTGAFSVSLTGLTDATTYYACAYAVNNVGTAYGEIVSFTTKEITIPTLSTTDATKIEFNSATVGGKVTNDNGATVTERGVCWATTANPTVSNNKKASGTGTGSFTVTLSSLSDGTTYYVRAYAKNSKGIAYGNTVTFTTVKKVTVVNGAIQKAFSVSATKKVYFSQGNLQYQASTGTLRFAGHQYDTIGVRNASIKKTYSGWIDLFGWGTGKQPYLCADIDSDYGNGSNDIAGTDYDWGVYNKISNGGNQAGLWRTLTKDEWEYLLFKRAQAVRLLGTGKINGVYGLILLPDGWETPSSITFLDNMTLNTHLSGDDLMYYDDDFSCNVYSLAEWTIMESYGAVFLPAGGHREIRSVKAVGKSCWYWSSSVYDSNEAWGLTIERNASTYMFPIARHKGFSVRLVQDVK